VEEAKALMKAASVDLHADKMVPYFAVCLFAGLRPSEATRLDWSRIRFEDERIEILKATTKTRRRRWAKIEPNGLEWLRPFARPSGLIVGGIADVTWKRRFNRIRIEAGLRPDPDAEDAETAPKASVLWGQDVMRHSFASYWLAVNKNAPELAEIMGNTVPIIRKHYENTVLESVAKGFWEIVPAKIETTIQGSASK
jgi:integrase